MTPEGKVKKRVKSILNSYGKDIYQHWPVLNGMGKPSLDIICCFHGLFFSIETKAEGKTFTDRQALTADDMRAARGKVFLINEKTGTKELEEWLKRVNTRANEKYSSKGKIDKKA